MVFYTCPKSNTEESYRKLLGPVDGAYSRLGHTLSIQRTYRENTLYTVLVALSLNLAVNKIISAQTTYRPQQRAVNRMH